MCRSGQEKIISSAQPTQLSSPTQEEPQESWVLRKVNEELGPVGQDIEALSSDALLRCTDALQQRSVAGAWSSGKGVGAGARSGIGCV